MDKEIKRILKDINKGLGNLRTIKRAEAYASRKVGKVNGQ